MTFLSGLNMACWWSKITVKPKKGFVNLSLIKSFNLETWKYYRPDEIEFLWFAQEITMEMYFISVKLTHLYTSSRPNRSYFVHLSSEMALLQTKFQLQHRGKTNWRSSTFMESVRGLPVFLPISFVDRSSSLSSAKMQLLQMKTGTLNE